MTRLGRAIFAISSATSLLLSVGVVVLWVRSYTGSDYVQRRRLVGAEARWVRHQSQSIEWTRGQVRFVRGRDSFYVRGLSMNILTPNRSWPRWRVGRLGEGHFRRDSPPAHTSPQEHSLIERIGFLAWHDGWMLSFADYSQDVRAVPAWAFVIGFGLLPAIWMWREARGRCGRRAASGRCIACGYDLRATPQRCPECGRRARDVAARPAAKEHRSYSVSQVGGSLWILDSRGRKPRWLSPHDTPS